MIVKVANIVAFGDPIEVRASAVLTNGYVAGTILDISEANQVVLFMNFTIGSLTSASVKVETSYDGTNYTQETFEAISAGVNTLSAGSNLLGATGTFTLPIDVMGKTMKVSAIGTGTVTNSLLSITALVGNV